MPLGALDAGTFAALALAVCACVEPSPPFEIACEIDAELTEDAAALEDGPVEEGARWLGDGRLYIERKYFYSDVYYTHTEVWIELRAPSPPRVTVSPIVHYRDGTDLSWHLDLRGTIVVNSAGADLRSGEPDPFILAYDVIGMCKGSDVRREGKFVIRAADIETE